MSDELILTPYHGHWHINNKPVPVVINLDVWPMGYGFSSLSVKINDHEYVFTKEEVHALIKSWKNGGKDE